MRLSPNIRWFVLSALALGACGTTKEGRRFTRDELSTQLKRLETVALELGEFPIEGAKSVLDGDTVRVKGLTSSMRLLGLDTEETFKHANERQAFAAGWESYKKSLRGGSSRPVKMATPLGEDAKHFAQAFFEGATSVRLERDHPGEIRDYYGRYLAYVFAKKDGAWVNYNVACVRAGMSPYFVKYGRSRRFHRQFVEAQEAAQAEQLGIWKPGAMHYDDYPERLKWWGEREAAISRFEQEAEAHPDSHVSLTRWDALRKLEQRMGQEAVVLAAVQEVRLGDRGPSVVKLARSRTSTLDVVFFDKDLMLSTGIQFKRGEYVAIRGTVNRYRDSRGLEHLQMQVTVPGQVLSPSTKLEERLSGDSTKPDEALTEAEE